MRWGTWIGFVAPHIWEWPSWQPVGKSKLQRLTKAVSGKLGWDWLPGLRALFPGSVNKAILAHMDLPEWKMRAKTSTRHTWPVLWNNQGRGRGAGRTNSTK